MRRSSTLFPSSSEYLALIPGDSRPRLAIIGGVNAEAGGRSPFVAGEERASLLEDCQLGPLQNTLFRGLHVGFREG